MTASGSLTHDQMVAACRNIGFDLTCGACSGQFFTGSGMGEHTCPGAQAKMTRVGRDPKLLRKSVREMPRGELEKNYLCSLLQIDAYAMTGDRTHVLEAAILESFVETGRPPEYEHRLRRSL